MPGNKGTKVGPMIHIKTLKVVESPKPALVWGRWEERERGDIYTAP